MQMSELEEVCFMQNVKCGGETTARILVNNSTPWSVSVDGGIVTVKHKKNEGIAYVPLTNVAFMRPKKATLTATAEAPKAAPIKAKK